MPLKDIPFNKAYLHLAEALALPIDETISGNGPISREVERQLASILGIGSSLLTPSCTHALELAARLINIEPGDEVIVPAFTFPSTASAFALHGARPVFVDVSDDTLNIDFDQTRAAITPQTKAVCIVHYAGEPASPSKFADLCREHGLILLEDNAHGLFGSSQGRPLGTFGHLSTMSFHETKNITCGEGGALHLNDESLLERAEIIREKGTDRSKFLRGEVDKYTWRDLGSSWILSDILASLLLGQLSRFEEIQRRRHEIWDCYARELTSWAQSNDIRLPCYVKGSSHAAHLFHLRLPNTLDRTRFMNHFHRRGVGVAFHYQSLNVAPAGLKFGGFVGQCPVSEEAAGSLVRLPLHLHLTDADVERVISAATSFRT